MKPRKKQHRNPRPVLVILLIWLVPVAVWGTAIVADVLIQRKANLPVQPETVVAGSRTIDARLGVRGVATFKSEMNLRLEGQGTITGFDLVVGTPVEPGTKAMEVDGVPRMAYSGETPFFRDLHVGDVGKDVLTLTEFLRDLGFLSGEEPGSLFSQAASVALSTFQSEVNLTPDGVLRKEEFIYIPRDFGEVVSVQVSPGDPVPADGVFATGSGQVSALRIVDSAGEKPPKGFPVPGELRLSAGPEELLISSLSISGDEAVEVTKKLRSWAAEELIEVGMDDDSQIFEGLQISLAVPFDVASVPSTAIMAGLGGETCVIQNDEGSGPEAVPVTVQQIAGELGVVGIDPSLAGTQVLRDARSATPKGVTCR